MPPAARAPGGTSRRALLVATPLLLLAAAYGFIELGPFLAREDPLQKADAIFVLAGTPMRRALEGADLYLAGYGPFLVLSRESTEGGFAELTRRGVSVPDDVARAQDVFRRMGIPAKAVIVPLREHRSTAAEAQTLRAMAQERGWDRVIIVSSPYHLRRSAFAFRRELEGTAVAVVMRATRYETAEPARWWRYRSDVRSVVQELPRLVAYVLGLGA
ncbi:MAG: hypothetical protein A3H29_17300 [Acidobacteria bacterium RIFCSPLOWO2_02_FULL_67_21]|nr:MAG: hypothetical protein A3H29_17300 [Acidobacteria bacterium RIFCSPLOWO2_02_FULL_67_21]